MTSARSARHPPPRADRAAFCEHSSAHGLHARHHLIGDLRERQTGLVQRRSPRTTVSIQARLPSGNANLADELRRGAAMHPEPRRDGSHGLTCLIGGDQLGALLGAQSSLRLRRSIRHRPARVLPLRPPRPWAAPLRPPENAADQGSEGRMAVWEPSGKAHRLSSELHLSAGCRYGNFATPLATRTALRRCGPGCS